MQAVFVATFIANIFSMGTGLFADERKQDRKKDILDYAGTIKLV